MLGAVTDDSDSFYCWTEENLETRHGIWLLGALQEEFGEELVVFLGRTGYSTRELSGSTSVVSVRGESLAVWYFPPKLSDSIPWKGAGIASRNGSNTGSYLIFQR